MSAASVPDGKWSGDRRDPQWLHRAKVGTLMTRGVLIDIAGLKGVDILPISYEITVADLEQALQKQGLSLPAGVLYLHRLEQALGCRQ